MITSIGKLSAEVKQYFLITANYWAFTLTDGALRMLVILHFHELGYSPLQIAMLFLFYEVFGVITNLFGGWMGASWGLNRTMNVGLVLQVFALAMLLVPVSMLTVFWVMAAQAISGIAKDLNKMSAKSSLKLLVPSGSKDKLYAWVALLTGSKNALKGIGFFLGGLLLSLFGFYSAVFAMAVSLLLVWFASMFFLKKDFGKASNKPKFTEIFSKSSAVNILSAARLFLFGARDVWFVVALPIYLGASLGWDYWQVSGFLAAWVIVYGFVQTIAPYFTAKKTEKIPDGKTALRWALPLALIPALIAVLLSQNLNPSLVLIIGLIIFGTFFAINSSLHSYLILSYAREDGVSMDVGFYYMANALGRLLGTVLSGWLFQQYGLPACLWVSCGFILVTAGISIALPRHNVS